MITEAIWEEKKWQKGSSRTDIRKFIEKNYDVDESKIKSQLSSNFTKMLKEGDNGYACLRRTEDDTDSYKLTPEWRKEWTKKYGKKHPKKTRKTKKDPNHPKHPRNGYLYFSQDVRKRRQDQYPDKGFKEITTLVADEWRNLSVSKKKKYLDLAKKDRARYQKEMKDYKDERSESEGSTSESESDEKRKRKRAKRSDDEESRSHSAKKRKSRSKTAKSSSESDSDEEEKKKKNSEKHNKTPSKVAAD